MNTDGAVLRLCRLSMIFTMRAGLSGHASTSHNSRNHNSYVSCTLFGFCGFVRKKFYK